MDTNLEALIIETLQSAGPMEPGEIADELCHRRRLKTLPEFDGLIGVGAIKTALKSLALQGRVRRSGEVFEYIPPARPVESVPSGRMRQASLF